MKDSLGDRIKGYESISDHYLMKRTPVIIRIDGRAFHTYTRAFNKPFSDFLRKAFRYATEETLGTISGWKLAYHQSDEISILITDYDTLHTQGHFGYRINKINSVTASTFTANFNKYVSLMGDDEFRGGVSLLNSATFDCRCFNIPEDEIANYFLWRQKDRERNSLSMYAGSIFSHKKLQGKNRQAIHDMLHEEGKNWNDLDPVWKNGTYFIQGGCKVDILPKYENIQDLVDDALIGQYSTCVKNQ